MTAQQLLAYANAKNGLPEVSDNRVLPSLLQVFHTVAHLSLTRKKHTVGTAKFLLRVRKKRIHTQSFQRIHNRIDIAGIIFYYSYVHFILYSMT